MKQVVFIAGTAYSGSSMFDMMIGNTYSSFSTGEVQYFFRPIRNYQIDPPCGCGNTNCELWSKVKLNGERNLYASIFSLHRYVDTIVDSSKDPFWIAKQRKMLNQQGIRTNVLLIWKHPEEFALSRVKRGLSKNWKRAWINYHRLFFALNDDWRSVEYRSLTIDPEETLRRVCEHISIAYNSEMKNFWEKRHHILFGNLSAKYHTLDKGKENYEKIVNNLSTIESKHTKEMNSLENRHRTIFYDSEIKKKLPVTVIESLSDHRLKKYVELIKNHDVGLTSPSIHNLVSSSTKMHRLIVELYRLRGLIKEQIFNFRNRNRISLTKKNSSVHQL